MNCEHIEFSAERSRQRIHQARTTFGDKVIDRILAWALFLLGASKPVICTTLDIRPGSLRTLLYRLQNQGLGTLEDRRIKHSSFKPKATPAPVEPSAVAVYEADGNHCIQFSEALHLKVPTSNPLLYKSLLLCLLNNRMLSRKQVAQALQLSEDRVGKLAKKLTQDDVNGLLDQRRGQRQEYVFTPTIKGELIQQFVIDLVQDGKMSGEGLARHLKARCQYDLSPRSLLYQLNNMGLSKIKNTLPAYLEAAKKTLQHLEPGD